MKILIKSVKIADPSSKHHLKKRDVYLKNGKIEKIAAQIDMEADKTIKPKDGWLSLGWFDMWAFTADPGFESKENLETFCEAARRGGFTHVCTLPNTQPVIASKNQINYLTAGNPYRVTQLLPIAAVTQNTEGEDLTEMVDLFEGGSVAFSDGYKPLASSELMIKALQYLQKNDNLLIHRPLDPSFNARLGIHEGIVSTSQGMPGVPALAESMMVQRDLSLLPYAGGRLHLAAISTAESVKLIKKAKSGEPKLSCSVAAYQALLSDEDMIPFDPDYKLDPPLRSQKDNKALISGLKDGTIDVIISNHFPQDIECKKLEFDLAETGMIGLQTVAPCLVSLSEHLGMEDLLMKVTHNPRLILNREVAKIEEGAQADLTLLDTGKKWVFNKESNGSKSFNTPYKEKEMTGKVIFTMKGSKYFIDEQ